MLDDYKEQWTSSELALSVALKGSVNELQCRKLGCHEPSGNKLQTAGQGRVSRTVTIIGRGHAHSKQSNPAQEWEMGQSFLRTLKRSKPTGSTCNTKLTDMFMRKDYHTAMVISNCQPKSFLTGILSITYKHKRKWLWCSRTGRIWAVVSTLVTLYCQSLLKITVVGR